MGRSVFFSYSHVDHAWMRRVKTHIQALGDQSSIDLWVDTAIGAGELWRDEIRAAICRAQAAVLLLSADFMASGFIRNEEIPRLITAERERGIRLFPVLARPCAFETLPWLSEMQVRPLGAKPLSAKGESDMEAALVDIARELDAALDVEREVPAPSAQLDAPSQAEALLEATRGQLLDYYFYLAHRRINSLYQQLPVEFLKRQPMRPLTRQQGGGALGGVTQDLAIAAARLPLVTEFIEATSRVGDLSRVVADALTFDFDFYLADLEVRCSAWSNAGGVVKLVGRQGSYDVHLACTKSDVLGLVKEGDTLIPTSAAYFIFEESEPVRVKGMLRIISVDRERRRLNATPLYLQLSGALGG